ncbi:fructose 1,6-bisphosphatase [Basilea psittacipulmonis DSM 24701]|uniref:Fructose-1,6-bisphosphatase class 1 n=2 Tax=Basilea TaxID=1472344 RepID=A0A077DEU2_9BURK|nr:class 1 fructose-bisphosphatase [Basilea psittacipulmonis]AIL32676.1 fructose 1,6-bisphosphatase [Basilea psittacipulmonis DSM 24701]
MNLTLSQYLHQHTNDPSLKELLQQLCHTCTMIAHAVSKGALSGVLGSTTHENVQGEVQKKLDVISNQMLLEGLEWTGTLSGMASEEMDEIYPISSSYQKGPYLLLFDPLDGSSNIDVNVSIGTIFSILKAPHHADHQAITEKDFLQKGREQIAAGYVIYGPQTMLVMTLGKGVVGFTLDRDTATWYLTVPEFKIPSTTKEFAINMSNMRHWEPNMRAYIEDCLAGETGPLKKNYNMRWIAAMVTDVHRILNRGGVFAYPWDAREPGKAGKLRLMYEANPMSFLVEQAGGKSITGKENILDIEPEKIHQRVPVILGSAQEVDCIQEYLNR